MAGVARGKTVIRRGIPTEFQPPSNLPHRLLRATGYFRVRTRIAAHGAPVPEIGLYQPLYSPWEGDPAFTTIYSAIKPYTLVSRDRCWVLWRTLQQALNLNGDAVECGVFRGGTARLAATTLSAEGRERLLHLFDSFEGMPTGTEGIDRFEKGDFSTTSLEAIRRLMSDVPFARIHAGYIPDTFDDANVDAIAWAHVDVDLYQTVLDCIEYIYPRLVTGAFVIFDDYGFPSCVGARRAVDEAFVRRPEVPLCLPTGQCLVVKI